MKEVKIDGEIGYSWLSDSSVTGKTIEAQLKGLEDGEDINITINSPGGSVYEAIVIYNLICDYAKSHPVSVRINGIAMSAASYIALAARTVNKNAKITVSENSVFMIHNPWGVVVGDYREQKKQADYMEKLTTIFSAVYSSITGTQEEEMRELMNDETYYVGKEIEDAGFANNFETSIDNNQIENTDADAYASRKNKLVINARLALDKTIEKTREANAKNPTAFHDDLDKIAALIRYQENGVGNNPATTAHGGGVSLLSNHEANASNIEGGTMTPEELLAKDKACYMAILELGKKAALETERQRVAAHLRRGEKVGAMNIALKHIQSGASVQDEAVEDEYLNAALNKKHLDARAADNPGDVNVGDESGQDDDAKLAAAWDAGIRGLEAGGKK